MITWLIFVVSITRYLTLQVVVQVRHRSDSGNNDVSIYVSVGQKKQSQFSRLRKEYRTIVEFIE